MDYLIWDLGNHILRCICAQNSGVFWWAGLESPVVKDGSPSASSSAPAWTAGCTPASPLDASSCQGNYGRCEMSHFACYWQTSALFGSAVTFVRLIETQTSNEIGLLHRYMPMLDLCPGKTFPHHQWWVSCAYTDEMREKSRQSDSNQQHKKVLWSLPCWKNAFHSNSSSAATLPLTFLALSRILLPLSTEQTRVKRIKWVLYLLKLSFFSPLVRHVSRCLLIKCCGTLTEHTGHSTAKDTYKQECWCVALFIKALSLRFTALLRLICDSETVLEKQDEKGDL